jgi:pyruvate/2-oxoglutarate/acetoin dehydrogenase E1 component
MARLAVDFQRTASTTASLGSLVADATRPRRISVYQIMFGSEAAPADQAILWQVGRITAAGTSTAVTPLMIDNDVATEADAGENHSVEPTYTANANMLNIPANQKATVLWQTLPELGIIIPGTASNGFGLRTPTITSGTPVITSTWHALEY